MVFAEIVLPLPIKDTFTFSVPEEFIDKIEKGYNGSVKSKKYRIIWESERRHNRNLFKTIILKTFSSKLEATESEEKLQKYFSVHRNPMYINQNISGKYFSAETKFKDIEFQREMSRRAHSNPNYSKIVSAAASRSNAERISNKTHNFLNNGTKVSTMIREKLSRANVQVLKSLIETTGVKLGRCWNRKSDDWIDSKIRELTAAHQYSPLGNSFL